MIMPSLGLSFPLTFNFEGVQAIAGTRFTAVQYRTMPQEAQLPKQSANRGVQMVVMEHGTKNKSAQ